MFGKRRLIDLQEPKKKKKWKEELHDDLDDIDLECLKYIEEEEDEDVDNNTITNNNDDGINECDNKESSIYSDLLDEKNKINKDLNVSNNKELTNNISNDNQCVNKKRRYDWMSSDDEDITSDDDEEVLIKEDIKENTTDKIKCDTSNNIKDKISKDLEQNISEYEHINNNSYNNNNHEDKIFIKVENKNNSINNNNNITYDILNDINKFSINPVDIQMEDIEHIITYIYFNNIHFNCSIKNFVQFLENNINNKIIQINSDKLTNHTILYKYDEKSNDTVIIDKFTHHGKLFVHVKTYEDVVRLLKLNETNFMGRVIKSIQAYRKNDKFFILQAPSQYKYFIHLAVNEKNKRKRKG
ncbi:hypothetical protein PGSY75_1306700 [Plasmodium gaboni]|uniref:RRM domain-containing protein n=1 Tax=Plasmodium gaboni TaxID=647221 RepID=A0A151LD55_9APIC|nr:hypothetical protein PGSY75_1306700 [Plasmodium gaboni]KYN96869.1 hypothetical protein PGSY75_1306700 [Plasmodium gaboni]